jgi:EAL domain-containing protein (putative c-di-GMP-specific phosphodiesterase class I)
VPQSRITLEITESAAMSAPAATIDNLTRFRLKDFNVSLDDFGTGYSSLVQLYRLPFNELKIDKSFVMDIGVNSEAEIIVDILALLGKKLGLKVCAEGIENGAMLRHVQKSGCDLGQGYLFSKPVAADMIEVLARRWSAGSDSPDQGSI